MSKRSAYNIKKIVAVYDSDMLGVQAYHYYNDEGEEYPEVIYKFDPVSYTHLPLPTIYSV